MSHIRDIIENSLSKDDAIEFAKYVWGDEYESAILHSEETVRIWNEKYGHKLTLSEYGTPSNDIPKMIKIWEFESKK